MDHSTDPNFLAYYEQQSAAPETLQRFRALRDKLLTLFPKGLSRPLTVVDIGCGAGTQARLWAELGHRAHGLDVSEPLIAVAKRRSAEAGFDIVFDVGTATALPYPDLSMDVVLLPELLEHVQDWTGCLSEAARVLRPGGVLYLSTTNALCPMQQEFNLPLYSWYPAPLKRHYERLAVTTRPDLANYATYPAVHWFTFFQLRRFLAERGLACLDRFEMIDREGRPVHILALINVVRSVAPLRALAQVVSPSTIVFAIKSAGSVKT